MARQTHREALYSISLMLDKPLLTVGSSFQVQHLVGRLTDMGVTEILPRKTYNIKDFFSRQQTLVEEFAKNFGEFRNLVCQVSSVVLAKLMTKKSWV